MSVAVTVPLTGVSCAVLALPAAALAQATGEVEIFSWWAGDEGPALEAIIAEFEKRNPGVRINNATVTGGAGVNAKALSTYMGHSSITITLDRYGHLMPGNEQESAGLLNDYLERRPSSEISLPRPWNRNANRRRQGV